MHRPQRWRPSRRQPRTTGVLRARLLRPQASRDGSSSLLESGQRRRLRWAESRAHANAGASSAGQHRVIVRSTKRPGRATSARPGVQGSPQRDRHCHETVRAEYEAQVSHPFGAGAGSPSCAPGTGCSPANGTLRSLDDWLVLRVINALPLRFYYDLPKRRQKSLGCLRIERNTNILGRPQLSSNFPADVRSRLKDTPQFVR